VQQMWQQAQAAVPHPQKAQVRFPAATGEPVIFDMVAQSAPHANALSYVHVDPRSGQVLEHVPHAANRLTHKIYLFAAALHYGWIGGVAGQLLLMLGALAVPVLAWTGTASFLRSRRQKLAKRLHVKIANKTVEAERICSFELVDPRGKPLPPFTAGAHIDVHLPGGLVRQYSLCNDPRETHRYLLAVMHTTDSRGGSRALHDMVDCGDILDISRPRNHFPLAEGATRSLLFAGGIGITPIISMAERLAAAGADFSMHYCVRSPARAAFRERIARSAYADRVFHYSGDRRIDLVSVLAAPDGLTHLYVCGPAGFMDAVISCALAHGWRDDQVHREYFVANPVGHADDTAFDIRIASSGAIVHVAKNITALDALVASGIEVPSSCRQGMCGMCLTPVIDGEPDHRDLFMSTAEHAANDQFAPCCSRSRSAVLTLGL
jgi:ferredoxin-NADP reductase